MLGAGSASARPGFTVASLSCIGPFRDRRDARDASLNGAGRGVEERAGHPKETSVLAVQRQVGSTQDA
jgi:hypothetical protein